MHRESTMPRRMTPRSSVLRSVLLGAALTAGAAACVSESPDDDARLGTSTEEIIGGFPATSAKLNAIGTLARDADGSGTFSMFCTGTLISPTMVLTAKHCVQIITDPASAVFQIGPDARAPIRTVPVRGAAAEPTLSGGVLGLGADMAIVHLAEPVTDVAPLPVAALTDDRLGSRMVGVGYGIQDDHRTYGTRRAGSMTLKATGGRVFEAAYGSFEGFLEEGVPQLFPFFDPSDPEVRAGLQRLYDETLLLDGIEAWFGAGPGDAQSCKGDSGGPITARVGSETTVFGVASWVLASWAVEPEEQCALDGGAYASINPVTLDFIDYETHCPLIPREGTCEGETVAVRCASPDEGGRRALRTDCGELGQVCGVDETGALGCIDEPRKD